MTRRALRHGDADVSIDADDARPLLDVLRTELGVRSASRACTDGTCGACRVIVDGALMASCRVTWGEIAEGARIETYETLASDPAAVRAVDAFAAERPTRCRMCVGALGVTAVSLARGAGAKSGAIDAALESATCMCTGRGSWRRALEA
jgi:aerobic-type carbon monoxide dehydrogenase small subunit (CoxS/CutS family)